MYPSQCLFSAISVNANWLRESPIRLSPLSQASMFIEPYQGFLLTKIWDKITFWTFLHRHMCTCQLAEGESHKAFASILGRLKGRAMPGLPLGPLDSRVATKIWGDDMYPSQCFFTAISVNANWLREIPIRLLPLSQASMLIEPWQGFLLTKIWDKVTFWTFLHCHMFTCVLAEGEFRKAFASVSG